jgi:hypothetical protein
MRENAISDLEYSDYSDYFIGHSGSTYYTKPFSLGIRDETKK